MSSLLVEAVGMLAGTLTTGAFLPQAIKTYRTRQTRDISVVMYGVMCCGMSTWILYGWLIGSAPIIAANVVALVLALSVLTMKLRFR